MAAYEYSQQHNFDIYIILNVFYPFKNFRYILKAVDTLSIFNLDSVVSVRPDDSVFYLHSGKGLVDRRPDALTKHERDDLFRRSGGITVTTAKNLMETKMLVSGKIGHIMVDQISSFEIRTRLDLNLFSLIVNAKLHH
jgi:CMP-N-acetylneuraminic acid synthetase